MGFKEPLRWQTLPGAGKVARTSSTGTEVPELRHEGFPCTSLHLAVRGSPSYNTLANVSKCLPEFSEPVHQITEPEEGVVGAGTHSQSVRVQVTSWGL